MVHGEFVGQPVEVVGQNAGPDQGRQHVEQLGHQAAGAAHAFEILRAVETELARADLDLGVGGLGALGFVDVHACSLRRCIT